MVGLVCLALDVLALGWLFVMRDMGNDAAGRGVATGFALVLTPVVLAAGAGLWWAERKGSTLGLAAAVLVLGAPFLFVAWNWLSESADRAQRAVYRSGLGRFADPKLTAVAQAIAARDLARVRELVGAGGLDWSARDARGQTLLGYAVERATGMEGGPVEIDMVEALVRAGAPYRDDAVREKGRLFSSVVYDGGDKYVKLIGLLLDAGANPNDTEEFDHRPLLLHHNMTVEKARVLLAHGAELKGLRDSRPDRPQWSALMNAVYMQQWELALFYLEQGCDAGYRAPDGRTVRDVLAELRRDGMFREHEAGAAFAAFEQALAKKPR